MCVWRCLSLWRCCCWVHATLRSLSGVFIKHCKNDGVRNCLTRGARVSRPVCCCLPACLFIHLSCMAACLLIQYTSVDVACGLMEITCSMSGGLYEPQQESVCGCMSTRVGVGVLRCQHFVVGRSVSLLKSGVAAGLRRY